MAAGTVAVAVFWRICRFGRSTWTTSTSVFRGTLRLAVVVPKRTSRWVSRRSFTFFGQLWSEAVGACCAEKTDMEKAMKAMKAKRRKILDFIRVLSVECYKHSEGGQMPKKEFFRIHFLPSISATMACDCLCKLQTIKKGRLFVRLLSIIFQGIEVSA